MRCEGKKLFQAVKNAPPGSDGSAITDYVQEIHLVGGNISKECHYGVKQIMNRLRKKEKEHHERMVFKILRTKQKKAIFLIRFSPGREKFVDEEHPGTWDRQLGYVECWLDYLRRDSAPKNLREVG